MGIEFHPVSAHLRPSRKQLICIPAKCRLNSVVEACNSSSLVCWLPHAGMSILSCRVLRCTNALLSCSVACPLLFVLVFSPETSLSPGPVSDLSLTMHGVMPGSHASSSLSSQFADLRQQLASVIGPCCTQASPQKSSSSQNTPLVLVLLASSGEYSLLV